MALAAFLTTTALVGGDSGTTRAGQSTAAALQNVISFIEWPSDAFASTDAPFVLGIIGNGPVGKFLEEYLMDETWHGRRILVRRLPSPAEARKCHALYIAASARTQWAAVSRIVDRLPILTLSDASNFAQRGGMVEFVTGEPKVGLVVNLDVARRAGLAISSKLLRLAEVIEDRTP